MQSSEKLPAPILPFSAYVGSPNDIYIYIYPKHPDFKVFWFFGSDKAHFGTINLVWIMLVSLFSSVLINGSHCRDVSVSAVSYAVEAGLDLYLSISY